MTIAASLRGGVRHLIVGDQAVQALEAGGLLGSHGGRLREQGGGAQDEGDGKNVGARLRRLKGLIVPPLSTIADRQNVVHSHRMAVAGRRQEDPLPDGGDRRAVHVPTRGLKDLDPAHAAILVDDRFQHDSPLPSNCPRRHLVKDDGPGDRPVLSIQAQGLGVRGLEGNALLFLAELDTLPLGERSVAVLWARTEALIISASDARTGIARIFMVFLSRAGPGYPSHPWSGSSGRG